MFRLNLLLLTALVGCSLLLVTAQYRARVLNTELERAQGLGRELDVRESQLRVLIAERSKDSLIEQKARKDLQMISLTPDRVMPARELK